MNGCMDVMLPVFSHNGPIDQSHKSPLELIGAISSAVRLFIFLSSTEPGKKPRKT